MRYKVYLDMRLMRLRTLNSSIFYFCRNFAPQFGPIENVVSVPYPLVWYDTVTFKLIPQIMRYISKFKSTFHQFRGSSSFNPLSANPTKWPNTLKQFVGKLSMNCLSVFGHFINLALKGLTVIISVISFCIFSWCKIVELSNLSSSSKDESESIYTTRKELS